MDIAFFDAKPYDHQWFDIYAKASGHTIRYIESRLSDQTAVLAEGSEAVCVFVNDHVDKKVISVLSNLGIRAVLLRCAGFNNVDFKAAFEHKLHVLRVPAYSPHAVAEYACALLLSINRKTHRAYTRTRDFNFNINGLCGIDLHKKTAGVVGTGKIGRVMIRILQGIGMEILAHDLFPANDLGVTYVELDDLFARSDVITLHCPLTPQTQHMINREAIAKMKQDVLLVNTSRGALIDSFALVEGIISGKIGGVALDVYEEEDAYFFEDKSNEILQDEALARLISFPNVLMTSHQAFFTKEAMEQIAHTTIDNLDMLVRGEFLKNEICYRCNKFGKCPREETKENCF